MLALRHRAGGGDGRGGRCPRHEQHDDAEVRQHEADQHQRHHHGQHDPDEAWPSGRRPLGVIASIFEAENDTPERSPMDQVRATRSVTLTGVNWPEAPDLAGDLDGDHLAGPAVADDEEVDLVDGDALGVESSAAWCRSRRSVRPGRPRRSARHWCQRASAWIAPSKAGRNFLPYL